MFVNGQIMLFYTIHVLMHTFKCKIPLWEIYISRLNIIDAWNRRHSTLFSYNQILICPWHWIMRKQTKGQLIRAMQYLYWVMYLPCSSFRFVCTAIVSSEAFKESKDFSMNSTFAWNCTHSVFSSFSFLLRSVNSVWRSSILFCNISTTPTTKATMAADITWCIIMAKTFLCEIRIGNLSWPLDQTTNLENSYLQISVFKIHSDITDIDLI